MIIMYVNATEFRSNVGKYLDLMQKEDIIIVKHGKPIGVLSASKATKLQMLEWLSGSCKYDGDLEDLLEKRLDEL